MKRSILVFLHIPKSAGTSFKTAVAQNYKISEMFFMYNRFKHNEKIKILKSKLLNNDIKLIIGHIGYGIHKYFSSDIKFNYITILRNPVKRVVSMYFHILNNIDHPFYNTVSKMTFKEYLLSGIDESAINSQTRFLSGSKFHYEMIGNDDFIGYDPFKSEEEMLEHAIINVKENIEFTGLTELFEDSLMLTKEKGILNRIYYKTFNKNNHKKYQIKDEEIRLACELNNLDIQLYDFATKHFNGQIEKHSDSLVKHKSNFKVKNSVLGGMLGIKTRIKLKIYENKLLK